MELAVASRVRNIDPRAKNPDGLSVMLESSSMHDCVDSACHAADENDTAFGECARQLASRPFAIRSGASSSYNRDHRLPQEASVSYAEKLRRDVREIE